MITFGSDKRVSIARKPPGNPGGKLRVRSRLAQPGEQCRPDHSVQGFQRASFASSHALAASSGLISVCANEIWVSDTASIGDCAPIMMSPEGGLMEIEGTNRAKIESPILQKFRAAAARNPSFSRTFSGRYGAGLMPSVSANRRAASNTGFWG